MKHDEDFDLDIIMRLNGSFAYGKADETMPYVYFRTGYIVFNKKTIEMLQIKEKSQIMFSLGNGVIHFANVTDHELRGYNVSRFKKSPVLFVGKSSNLKNRLEIPNGNYRVDETPFFHKKSQLDWYYLTEEAE